MDPDTSLVELLVLHATERGAAAASEGAHSLAAIARRSGIRAREVERVLSQLEEHTPPLVHRQVDEQGVTSWALSPGVIAPPTVGA
jgi:hypothetical protein